MAEAAGACIAEPISTGESGICNEPFARSRCNIFVTAA